MADWLAERFSTLPLATLRIPALQSVTLRSRPNLSLVGFRAVSAENTLDNAAREVCAERGRFLARYRGFWNVS